MAKNGGKPVLFADSFVTGLRGTTEREGAAPEAVTKRVEYAGVVLDRKGGRQLVIWVDEIGRGVEVAIGSALVRAAI